MIRGIAPALRTALFLLFAVPLMAAAQETQDTTALPESLQSARAALGEAWSKLDGAAVSAHFADNAVVEFDGQVLSGRPAVTGWLHQLLASLTALRPGGATTLMVGTDQVTERGGYDVITTSGGQQSGRSETVWKRQEDGSWKVARLIVL
jgi:ketosteroid isomerase-like protein